MPNYVFAVSQDDNQILVLTIDGETGGLTPEAEVSMPGGPSLLAISPNRQCRYVGHRLMIVKVSGDVCSDVGQETCKKG